MKMAGGGGRHQLTTRRPSATQRRPTSGVANSVAVLECYGVAECAQNSALSPRGGTAASTMHGRPKFGADPLRPSTAPRGAVAAVFDTVGGSAPATTIVTTERRRDGIRTVQRRGVGSALTREGNKCDVLAMAPRPPTVGPLQVERAVGGASGRPATARVGAGFGTLPPCVSDTPKAPNFRDLEATLATVQREMSDRRPWTSSGPPKPSPAVNNVATEGDGRTMQDMIIATGGGGRRGSTMTESPETPMLSSSFGSSSSSSQSSSAIDTILGDLGENQGHRVSLAAHEAYVQDEIARTIRRFEQELRTIATQVGATVEGDQARIRGSPKKGHPHQPKPSRLPSTPECDGLLHHVTATAKVGSFAKPPSSSSAQGSQQDAKGASEMPGKEGPKTSSSGKLPPKEKFPRDGPRPHPPDVPPGDRLQQAKRPTMGPEDLERLAAAAQKVASSGERAATVSSNVTAAAPPSFPYGGATPLAEGTSKIVTISTPGSLSGSSKDRPTTGSDRKRVGFRDETADENDALSSTHTSMASMPVSPVTAGIAPLPPRTTKPSRGSEVFTLTGPIHGPQLAAVKAQRLADLQHRIANAVTSQGELTHAMNKKRFLNSEQERVDDVVGRYEREKVLRELHVNETLDLDSLSFSALTPQQRNAVPPSGGGDEMDIESDSISIDSLGALPTFPTLSDGPIDAASLLDGENPGEVLDLLNSGLVGRRQRLEKLVRFHGRVNTKMAQILTKHQQDHPLPPSGSSHRSSGIGAGGGLARKSTHSTKPMPSFFATHMKESKLQPPHVRDMVTATAAIDAEARQLHNKIRVLEQHEKLLRRKGDRGAAAIAVTEAKLKLLEANYGYKRPHQPGDGDDSEPRSGATSSAGWHTTRGSTHGGDRSDDEMSESVTSVSTPRSGGRSRPTSGGRRRKGGGMRSRSTSLTHTPQEHGMEISRLAEYRFSMSVSQRNPSVSSMASSQRAARNANAMDSGVQNTIADEFNLYRHARTMSLLQRERLMRAYLRAIQVSLATIENFWEGIEVDLACTRCCQLVREPVLLAPCGSTCCKQCLTPFDENQTFAAVVGSNLDCGCQSHEGFVPNEAAGLVAEHHENRNTGVKSYSEGALQDINYAFHTILHALGVETIDDGAKLHSLMEAALEGEREAQEREAQAVAAIQSKSKRRRKLEEMQERHVERLQEVADHARHDFQAREDARLLQKLELASASVPDRIAKESRFRIAHSSFETAQTRR